MQTIRLTIDKLVHGGQGLGTLEDGRKAFVWGVMPGESVEAQVIKKRRDFVDAVASEVIVPSPERLKPKDDAFLSTSPWQIIPYKLENQYKKCILVESFAREHIDVKGLSFHAPKSQWQYRNKMEYSFFGDEDGLHLALFNRGTHRKQIVRGSSIARPEIDRVAQEVVAILSRAGVRAGDLKSLMLRCDKDGNVVSALFVREEKFVVLKELEKVCQGTIVCFSNPKSPASVRIKDLYQYGDISLTDTLNSVEISYDVFSFFQVNLEIFEQALATIQKATSEDRVLDMYSGVGVIGLAAGNAKHLVESDPANISWAELNAKQSKGETKVIHASSEGALDYIDGSLTVIVDPPRAGLHSKLVAKLNEAKPSKIIYLSCNPSTQARDIKLLEQSFALQKIEGYNFFPKTPHIESLAILHRK